ncbi:hypothetical protein C1N91_03865 [Curtobacterium sp. SGAir0471]|uniref:hypothetical protein n=1 Tax=Curtobacterium sp. SGAir0471 TaxID=2070337 RepID=UPI0010CD42EE|nr:hypothetical protein [Curtobacterium sp. SGAir0471]QCR42805.1 hypothetical protein C1N91_03865 [Curtobacterium sp. SGAir0471]
MPAPTSQPLVLVLPGSGYGQQAPLLWWTRAIAEQHDIEVVAPAWTVDSAAKADPVAFVERQVTRALDGRRPDLVVAKSFGCFALPWAVRRGVDGVWLTPVLTDPAVAAALAAAGAESIAVGGSADPMWLPSAVGTTCAGLHTVDGADHALEVRGDWRRSQRLQSDVLGLVEERIATLVR